MDTQTPFKDFLQADGLAIMAGKDVFPTPTALKGGYQDMPPGKSASIEIRNGLFFDVFAPDASLLTAERMAHPLSNQCRFSGNTDRHYSVAEHSVHVSIMAEKDATAKGLGKTASLRVARQGLVHDGSESVLQDVPSPIKKELPEYKRIENPIQESIYRAHGVPVTMSPLVHEADMRMCLTEKVAFLGPEGLDRPEWTPLSAHYKPYRYSFLPEWLDRLLFRTTYYNAHGITARCPVADIEPTVYFKRNMKPAQAKRLFLKRYEALFA